MDGGAGMGAELHVARPPLLVRRLAGKSILLRFDERETTSRGMTYPCPWFSQKRKRSPTVGSIVLRLRNPFARPPLTCENMIPA
jgi:hypothetical protein